MALNAELIKSNEGLKDLTDDQIKTIETLSANDEAQIIGKRIGQLHEQYDKDIKEITGIEKASDTEKSYEYNKRVLKQYKEQLEGSKGLTDEVNALKSKVSEYEKQIAEGNTDAVLAQKLKDAEAKLTIATNELQASKETLTTKESEFQKKLKSIEVDKVYALATSDLKFKKEFSAVQSKLLKTANTDVLAKYSPDFIDENGKQILVFRDSENNIAVNKANGLKPYTYQELLKLELGNDVLDADKTQTGVNSKKPEGPGVVDLVDLTAAKTQVAADELIAKYLMQKGLVRGSLNFTEESKKIRMENNVDKLPMK